jgi:hypothetical protein
MDGVSERLVVRRERVVDDCVQQPTRRKIVGHEDPLE